MPTNDQCDGHRKIIFTAINGRLQTWLFKWVVGGFTGLAIVLCIFVYKLSCTANNNTSDIRSNRMLHSVEYQNLVAKIDLLTATGKERDIKLDALLKRVYSTGTLGIFPRPDCSCTATKPGQTASSSN